MPKSEGWLAGGCKSFIVNAIDCIVDDYVVIGYNMVEFIYDDCHATFLPCCRVLRIVC